MVALLFHQLYFKCTQISGISHVGVFTGLWFLYAYPITSSSARRHTESGHEVTDRCELLSNSAGGVVYPSCSVVQSEASQVVSLTLYVWLHLELHVILASIEAAAITVAVPIYCNSVYLIFAAQPMSGAY